MKRAAFYLFTVFLANAHAQLEASSASQTGPNILCIIADDCTFRDIGSYGGQAYTPNIDALADQGMRMERCFQAAPMCSPTRHNIYTGLYPVKSGAYPNHTFVNDDVRSIVHYLKPMGYRVALFGKTHINPPSVFPFEYSDTRSKTESSIDFMAAERLMKESAEAGQPFALFACSREPHTPWSKGKEFRERYPLDEIQFRPYMVDTPETRVAYRNYLAEISYFDQEVGRLLEMLEAYGHSENTLVMVLSEQGNNFPFAKWTCSDSGLQSGMVVRWPGHVEPGSTSDAMIEYVDICPTFVEVAGGELNPDFDGKSLLPVLYGKTDTHKTHVYGIQTSRGILNAPNHYGIRSVRDSRYKLIRNLDPNAIYRNVIDTFDWYKTWIAKAEAGDAHAQAMTRRHSRRPAIEFYDTLVDPYEMNNLADDPQHADRIARLSRRLGDWMASQGDLGQATELAAYERMLNGGEDFKAWKRAQEVNTP